MLVTHLWPLNHQLCVWPQVGLALKRQDRAAQWWWRRWCLSRAPGLSPPHRPRWPSRVRHVLLLRPQKWTLSGMNYRNLKVTSFFSFCFQSKQVKDVAIIFEVVVDVHFSRQRYEKWFCNNCLFLLVSKKPWYLYLYQDLIVFVFYIFSFRLKKYPSSPIDVGHQRACSAYWIYI